MAQSRTPAGSGAGTGTGSQYLVDATQIPTAIVWDEVPGLVNTLADGLAHLEITDGTLFSGTTQATSADWVYKFTAPDNGRIVGITYANGAVAMDGSVGWELAFINVSRSNASCAYFGFGSGTEAAKGTDNDVAVAANAVVTVSNSITATTARFNKGDVISCTADRDGTTGVGTFILLVSYESEGYTA
jgi:hypothetical protein